MFGFFLVCKGNREKSHGFTVLRPLCAQGDRETLPFEETGHTVTGCQTFDSDCANETQTWAPVRLL